LLFLREGRFIPAQRFQSIMVGRVWWSKVAHLMVDRKQSHIERERERERERACTLQLLFIYTFYCTFHGNFLKVSLFIFTCLDFFL
jgi:hypothetical protein